MQFYKCKNKQTLKFEYKVSTNLMVKERKTPKFQTLSEVEQFQSLADAVVGVH